MGATTARHTWLQNEMRTTVGVREPVRFPSFPGGKTKTKEPKERTYLHCTNHMHPLAIRAFAVEFRNVIRN